MATVTIVVCETCENKARKLADLTHSWWCMKPEQAKRLRELGCDLVVDRVVRSTFVHKIVCLHGRDVSLSPHECEDCSQTIGERNANCQ